MTINFKIPSYLLYCGLIRKVFNDEEHLWALRVSNPATSVLAVSGISRSARGLSAGRFRAIRQINPDQLHKAPFQPLYREGKHLWQHCSLLHSPLSVWQMRIALQVHFVASNQKQKTRFNTAVVPYGRSRGSFCLRFLRMQKNHIWNTFGVSGSASTWQ